MISSAGIKSIKHIKISSVLAKGAGVAGLALIGIDANSAGRAESSKFEKNHKSEALVEHYLADTKLESPSIVKSAVKKRIFQYNVDENFSGFFTSITGYLKGFNSMLVDNVIPLGLSAGALLTKGVASKMFGVGLLVYGGVFLLQEAFGVGKAKE